MKIVYFQGNNASFSQYKHHLIDSGVCQEEDIVKPKSDLKEIRLVKHDNNDNILIWFVKWIYIQMFYFYRVYILKLPSVPAYWVAFWQASIGGQSDLLEMNTRVDQVKKEESVIYYGVSRGGLVVARYCSELLCSGNLKGIVLEGAPFSIRKVISCYSAFLLEKITSYKRESLDETWISYIPEDIPILIISSTADEIVPVSHARKMYALLKHNQKRRVYLLLLENVNQNSYGTSLLYQSIVTQFLTNPTSLGDSRIFY
jgi:hypothetical protein